MEKLKVNYLKGRSFEASVRNHKFRIDLPLSSRGSDTGPTPPELFIASLASCVGMYLVFYCEKTKLDPAGIKIEADYEKTADRIEKISVEFSLPSAQSEKERKEAMEWAEKCLIHNTIQHKPEITITFTGGNHESP
jgi:uncharacterized OsmC-like protein